MAKIEEAAKGDGKMIHFSQYLFGYLALLIMVSNGVIGCSSSYKLPDIPIQKIANYKSYQNQNGVEAAIDVFYEEDRLSKYFGADLLYSGIVPILVIIGNNSNEPILVEKGNFILEKLSKPIKNGMPPFASTPVLKDQGDWKSDVLDSSMYLSFIMPIAALIPVFASPAFYKADVDVGRVTHNISTRALVDRGIYKGESIHGFLYLPFKDILTENSNIIFQAKIKNLLSQNIIIFRFQIDTNKIREKANKINETRNLEK